MKNEDLPFAFTLAFVLHLFVIAVYDLTRDFEVQPNQPRIMKIKLGSSHDDFTIQSIDKFEKQNEIVIQKNIEQEVGTELAKEEEAKIPEKKLDVNVSKRAKPKGSEYGNSMDDDAISSPTYLDLLMVTVQERSSIPQQAIDSQQYGSAVLRLSFNRNGYVKKYKLVRSTQYKILDNEAVRVADSLTRRPFPPVPNSFDRGQKLLTYDFPISFELSE